MARRAAQLLPALAWLLAIPTLLVPLLLAASSTASADGLVLGGSSVDATQTDDGYTAKVALLNTGSTTVTLADSVTASAGCDVAITHPAIEGSRATDLEVTFDGVCFGSANSFSVDLDGANGQLPAVQIKKPTGKSDWQPLRRGAVAGVVMALLTFIWALIAMNVANSRSRQKANDNKEKAARQAAYAELKFVVKARWDDLGQTAELRWKALPDPPGFGIDSVVGNLEAGWSFKDSWVANLTVASTGFVALATSVDVLSTVLGSEPKAALAVMTVTGVLSTALLALANGVVKAFGKSHTEVTVLGLALSSALVVGAATMQTVTIEQALKGVVSNHSLSDALVYVAGAVLLVVLLYAGRSLWRYITNGVVEKTPTLPDDAQHDWAADSDWAGRIVADRILSRFDPWLESPKAAGPPAGLQEPASLRVPMRAFRQASLL